MNTQSYATYDENDKIQGNRIISESDLLLDSRINEYLKKKKFYKKNNIISVVPLEKEFNINSNDIKKIKLYYTNKKSHKNQSSANNVSSDYEDIYSEYNKNLSTQFPDNFTDFIDPIHNNFPSEQFKKDKRFDRIKIKQKRIKEADEQRNNYGIIERSYDMYQPEKQFASTMGDNFNDINNNFLDNNIIKKPDNSFYINNDNTIDLTDDQNQKYFKKENYSRTKKYPKFSAQYIENFNTKNNNQFINQTLENPYVSVNKQKSTMTYNEPSISNHKQSGFMNNTRLHYGNNEVQNTQSYLNDVNNIIGDLDTYRKKTLSNYNNVSEMDLDHKLTIPKYNSNNKRNYENNYMSLPQMNAGSNLSRDIEVENYMKIGDSYGSSQSKKSNGFPSTFEYGFQYITNEFQHPNHVVSNRGISSRLDNKSGGISNKYERDILPQRL
jgi:hypothetical protein